MHNIKLWENINVSEALGKPSMEYQLSVFFNKPLKLLIFFCTHLCQSISQYSLIIRKLILLAWRQVYVLHKYNVPPSYFKVVIIYDIGIINQWPKM